MVSNPVPGAAEYPYRELITDQITRRMTAPSRGLARVGPGLVRRAHRGPEGDERSSRDVVVEGEVELALEHVEPLVEALARPRRDHVAVPPGEDASSHHGGPGRVPPLRCDGLREARLGRRGVVEVAGREDVHRDRLVDEAHAGERAGRVVRQVPVADA